MNPNDFSASESKRSHERIQELKRNAEKLSAEEEKRALAKTSSLEKKVKNSSLIVKGFTIGGLIASVVVFVSLMVSFPTSDDIQELYASWGVTLAGYREIQTMGSWLLFGAPGLAFIFILILGCVVQAVAIRSWKGQISVIKRQSDRTLQQYAEQRDESIAAVREEAAEAIEEHKISYEKERRSESVKYANSDVAKEIVALIIDGFKQEIETSDRRPHVQKVIVPLTFSVYLDKVESSYGVYDFEIERVARLNREEDQAALANAIANGVQTEIVMAYPEDISGGIVDPMEMAFDYKSNRVFVSMTYSADNGDYVPERSF